MNGNLDLMREWFTKAEHDLLNAQIILESRKETLPLDTVCFHCQQAVEKYLKGFLIYHQIEFSKTHFLGTLLDQCKEIDASFTELDGVIELSVYAVDVRYPDDSLELTLEDANAAYARANRAKDFVTMRVKREEHPQAEVPTS
jgi:HEPN domain-containing protein